MNKYEKLNKNLKTTQNQTILQLKSKAIWINLTRLTKYALRLLKSNINHQISKKIMIQFYKLEENKS